MKYNDFIANLEEFSKLKEKIKQRNLIFQVEDKEDLAVLCDLPLDSFYHLNLKKWGEISKLGMIFKERAEQDWKGLGTVLCGELWKKFKTKCYLAGAKTELDEIRLKLRK